MKITLTTLLAYLLTFSLFGQSTFIEPIPKEGFLPGNPQWELYQQLQQDDRYLDVTPVQMNSVWNFQNMGVLVFTLPGANDPIHARVTKPRRYNTNDYHWTQVSLTIAAAWRQVISSLPKTVIKNMAGSSSPRENS